MPLVSRVSASALGVVLAVTACGASRLASPSAVTTVGSGGAAVTVVPDRAVDTPPVPPSPSDPPSTPASTVPGQGTEIGFGRIGAVITLPQPWPVGTVDADAEPGALLVDFVPPDPGCIAAQATAEIGRGGAILVSLWVEGAPAADGCRGGAGTNRIRIPLAEPLGDRRTYTSTVPATQGASEEAELLADRVVGMQADAAVALIEREGYDVRDATGAQAVESDLRPDRITVWRSAGMVEFAAVG